MADICAVSLAASSPPDVATEASPWASFFTAAVAVQTSVAHAVCSAVGAAPVVEADDTGGVLAGDGVVVVVVVVVDPEHPVSRAAAAIRTTDWRMAFSRFARTGESVSMLPSRRGCGR
jgi:hypothetical protein